MISIENLMFYRTGEVVRDLGLIYFYKILKEMKSDVKTELELNNNYLYVKNYDEEKLFKYLIENKLFRIFLNGIEQDLKNINKDFLDGVAKEEFIDKINNNSDINQKTKEDIIKRYESQYFPYVRDSGKYGANAQNEKNFHKNLKKLINIVFKLNLKSEHKQKEIIEHYEPTEDKCIICHDYLTTKYDITHNQQKKERKNSKYNYLFMGSETTTFNNYAKSNSNVCFVCEFFNLMFLLYLCLERPSLLAYTDSLKNVEFINYKLLLNSNNFNSKGIYRELSKFKNSKIKIYSLITDSKKGVMINFNSVLEFENLNKYIKLNDISDKFVFSKDEYSKKALARTFIRNSNDIALKALLFNELFVLEDKNGKMSLDLWKSTENVKLYLEIINELRRSDDILADNGFENIGMELGNNIQPESKKSTIAFKIIQMLKSDNRHELFDILAHLIVANGSCIPKKFSDVIFDEDIDRLHYNIGKFLEKFLSINKSEEK